MISMAPLFKIGPQITVIVDLAVKNQPNIPRFAPAHRLMARRREIDDRQSSKAEAATAIIENMGAGVIRPTMRHCVAHRFDQRQFDASLARSIFPNSDNSAHIGYRYCKQFPVPTDLELFENG